MEEQGTGQRRSKQRRSRSHISPRAYHSMSYSTPITYSTTSYRQTAAGVRRPQDGAAGSAGSICLGAARLETRLTTQYDSRAHSQPSLPALRPYSFCRRDPFPGLLLVFEPVSRLRPPYSVEVEMLRRPSGAGCVSESVESATQLAPGCRLRHKRTPGDRVHTPTARPPACAASIRFPPRRAPTWRPPHPPPHCSSPLR